MTQISPRPQGRLPLGARRDPRRRRPLLREVYGPLIRRLRTRQGRTLTEVAARAGVSVAYLSEIERGLKEPSSEVLEAVCAALGSSIVHLVGAAHRELVIESGRAGLEIVGLDTNDVDELDEPVGSGVLDLTRRHPGRSRAVDASNEAAPGHFGKANLVAA
ncbi:MAG: helix-turn-helix transcriptional regulator [Terracoccus sp.]